MRMNAGWVVLCAVGLGCGSKWDFEDQDGDGISGAEGDCWDQSEGPEGSGLSGDEIHPDAAETWYDGFDQNCAGDDDFDADKDGFVPDEYLGEETLGLPESGLLPAGDCWDGIEGPEGVEYGGVEIFPGSVDSWYDGVDQDCGREDDFDADGDGFVQDIHAGVQTIGKPASGDLPGGDCWDDPATEPVDMQVVADGGWDQPKAKQVHPDASDEWYDGVDQDCAGNDDFDQDADGFATLYFPDRDGNPAGDDCVDRPEDLEDEMGMDPDYLAVLAEEDPDVIAPESINKDAEDAWYDGIDSNCDEVDDCDQDADSFGSPGPKTEDCAESGLRPCCDVGPLVDCDDENEDRFPDETVEEIHFNGVDDNCNEGDGDGDQDGDGWWAEDYLSQVEAYAEAHPDEEVEPMEIPGGYENDCVDDPDDPGLTGSVEARDIHPGAIDDGYNGIDEGCEGNDDFDVDEDGQIYENHEGLTTYPVPGTGDLPVGDCDDTDASIYTDAPDDWYDGVDSDCAGNVDFDADSDGFVPDVYDGETTSPWDDDEPPYDFGEAGLALDPVDLPDVDPGDCEDGEEFATVFDGTLFTGADIYPGAPDDWYDGVDSDCDERDDYDQDEDDYVTDAHDGLETYPVAGTGELDDGDCDDTDADFRPGALDIWYDGRDTNCDGLDDYDQDEDGFVRTEDVGESTYPVSGSGDLPGNDCDDTRADMNPSITDVWYDGDDSDCGGNDDYDQDGDDFVLDIYRGEETHPVGTSGDLPGGDCLDTDDDFYPDAPDAWYDGDDTNCWGDDDYDQDGDGYVQNVHDGRTTDPGGFGGDLPDGDCDDTNADANPGENENCLTGFDDNCDGDLELVGADNCTEWHEDFDGDGFGDPSEIQCSCDPIGDYNTVVDTDCDDSRDDTYPGAAGFEPELCAKDFDGDGYGDASSGPWDAGSDCDDEVSSTYEGATETCDTVDSDCDGDFNDEDSLGCDTYYRDFDDDDFGDASRSRCYCDPSGHYTAEVSGDCEDADGSRYPDAPETCDTVDSDCDLDFNDPDSAGCDVHYVDGDGDGYGNPSLSLCLCLPTDTYEVDVAEDCDDDDPSINPAADEVCDGIDNDCDTVIDPPESVGASTWYDDDDEDDYGDDDDTTVRCEMPSGHTDVGGDCDDDDSDINPVADEVCDGVDNDCDGATDPPESLDATLWYADDDGDDYGDDDESTISCDAPTGYVIDGGDCDDDDPGVNPGEFDYEGDGDEDCDWYIDEDEVLDRLAAGEDVLVFTELMYNPFGSDADQEWFELYNASDVTVDLSNWTFRYQRLSTTFGRTFQITPGLGLTVEPGEYLLMCSKNGTINGISDSECGYFYGRASYYSTPSECGDEVTSVSSLQMRNGGDFELFFGMFESDCTDPELGIADLTQVDSVRFTSSAIEGASTELAHELVIGGSAAGENNDEDNWCDNITDVFSSTGNSGTPGEENTCSEDDL